MCNCSLVTNVRQKPFKKDELEFKKEWNRFSVDHHTYLPLEDLKNM